MFQDASNAQRPEARYNLGSGNVCNPVTDFGADPTGAADATTAINGCAARNHNNRPVNVYLPAGEYLITNQIALRGQVLFGDGRATTSLKIRQTFAPSALGVINFTAAGNEDDSGSEVRDLALKFEQPADQGSRAAFQNLGSCTSTPGGTGCKYPPAFYCSILSGRTKLRDVRVSRSWVGWHIPGFAPNNQSGCVPYIDNVEMGAFDTGLNFVGDILDFSHIRNFHFWVFDAHTTAICLP
jgi:hypothetical protein